MTKLKFGSKVKYKNDLYFVTSVGKRVIRARRIFDIDSKYNSSGSLSNVIISIPVKAIKGST